jgi:alpha-glucosidase
MAYKHGDFLRMQFSCEQTTSGIKLHIGPHEGTYQSWWKQIQVEVYGWSSSSSHVLGKETVGSTLDPVHHMVSIVIPDDGRGTDLELTSQP